MAYGVAMVIAILGPALAFLVFISFLVLAAYVEAIRLVSRIDLRPPSPETPLLAKERIAMTFAFKGLLLSAFSTFALDRPLKTYAFMLVLVLLATGIAALTIEASRTRVRRSLAQFVLSSVFAVYLGTLAGLLIDLHLAGTTGAATWLPSRLPVWLLLAVIPVWAADVTAYAIGSKFGRHALVPSISPGKTREGTLAGFVAASATALALVLSFEISLVPGLVVAVLLGPAALLGDLLESMIKREAGAKDSGGLFPGHGGALDRIDSLFFVSVLVSFALYLHRPA